MSPDIVQITLFTAGVAALSTLCILPFGLALAWLLAKFQWRGKSIVETFVSLPLVMPPVATGLILLQLFGRRGPLGGMFHDLFNLDVVFTWRAVLVAASVMSFPLLVRAARIGFEEVSEELEDAARLEGASRFQVLSHVTQPLARRAIIAGIVQSFARALGEFGATIMIAGNIPGKTTTLSLAIYQSVQLGHDSEAYRFMAVSVVLAFAAIWVTEQALKKPERVAKSSS